MFKIQRRLAMTFFIMDGFQGGSYDHRTALHDWLRTHSLYQTYNDVQRWHEGARYKSHKRTDILMWLHNGSYVVVQHSHKLYDRWHCDLSEKTVTSRLKTKHCAFLCFYRPFSPLDSIPDSCSCSASQQFVMRCSIWNALSWEAITDIVIV